MYRVPHDIASANTNLHQHKDINLLNPDVTSAYQKLPEVSPNETYVSLPLRPFVLHVDNFSTFYMISQPNMTYDIVRDVKISCL